MDKKFKPYYSHVDLQYLNLVEDIFIHGEKREDRTGTGTYSLFSPPELRINMEEGFPMLTTKKLPFRIIAEELLWFRDGGTHIKPLLEKNVGIWTDDAYRHYLNSCGETAPAKEWFVELIKQNERGTMGDLGPVYGKQWRNWNGLDQIKSLVYTLKNNPHSRRHIVSAWNVGALADMALPPCHILFQGYVSKDGGLSLKMYQRSADVFLGLPFNIASYGLLLHMLAQVTGYKAKELILTLGDAHIYTNHIEQLEEQLDRTPRKLPTLCLNPDITDIDDFTIEDMLLEGYDPHPLIKGKLSVGE